MDPPVGESRSPTADSPDARNDPSSRDSGSGSPIFWKYDWEPDVIGTCPTSARILIHVGTAVSALSFNRSTGVEELAVIGSAPHPGVLPLPNDSRASVRSRVSDLGEGRRNSSGPSDDRWEVAHLRHRPGQFDVGTGQSQGTYGVSGGCSRLG